MLDVGEDVLDDKPVAKDAQAIETEERVARVDALRLGQRSAKNPTQLMSSDGVHAPVEPVLRAVQHVVRQTAERLLTVQESRLRAGETEASPAALALERAEPVNRL